MRTHRRVGVTVLLLIASVAAIAILSSSGSNQSTASAVSTGLSASTNGMRVYLDPETGEVTSTPSPDAVIELDAAMENTLRHDDEGLTLEHHAGGAASMNLQGRYGDVAVVRVGENGKMTFCTGDAAEFERSMNDNTTPTGPEVK